MRRCKKRQYNTRLEAEAALMKLQQDPRRHVVRTYLCPICNRWHLTSLEERR